MSTILQSEPPRTTKSATRYSRGRKYETDLSRHLIQLRNLACSPSFHYYIQHPRRSPFSLHSHPIILGQPHVFVKASVVGLGDAQPRYTRPSKGVVTIDCRTTRCVREPGLLRHSHFSELVLASGID